MKLSDLTKEQYTAIQSYMPGYFNDLELPNHILNTDDRIDQSEFPNENMDAF